LSHRSRGCLGQANSDEDLHGRRPYRFAHGRCKCLQYKDFLVNEIATLRRSAQTELALHCGFGVLPLCLDVVCHRLSRSTAFGVLIVGVAARDQSADALRMGNAAIPDNQFHYVCSNHAHHAVRGGSFTIGRGLGNSPARAKAKGPECISRPKSVDTG